MCVFEFRVLTMSNQCVVRVLASPRCHFQMSEMSTAELLTRMCSNLVTVLPQQRAALDNFRACGGARKQNSVHNKKDCHMLKHVLIRTC